MSIRFSFRYLGFKHSSNILHLLWCHTVDPLRLASVLENDDSGNLGDLEAVQRLLRQILYVDSVCVGGVCELLRHPESDSVNTSLIKRPHFASSHLLVGLGVDMALVEIDQDIFSGGLESGLHVGLAIERAGK